MNKKLLILGSDFSTVHIAEEAKKMGVYVIVTDLMETSPTKEVADEAWSISTTDIPLLISKINEHKIDGVLAGASEFNLENVRTICKELKLPCYCSSDKAWEVARNKRKFKDLCKKHGVKVATDFELVDSMEKNDISHIEYPVVVKPVDKSGNKGMSYCNNKDELLVAYKKAQEVSDNEVIIIEKQLRGPEYTGYYVLADGEINLSYYTSMHHKSGYPANLYSLEYMTSCHLKKYLEEMNDGIIEVFKEAGCKDGIAWVETMYDQDGHFYALEMGYRFAGPGIYAVHEKASGFNTYKWMVEYALGVKHTINDLPTPLEYACVDCVGAYDLFTNCEGIIDSIEGLDKIEKLDNIAIDMPKRVGDHVRKNANMGIIKIYGKNCEEMCNTMDYINSTLRIYDSNHNNMFIIFDEFEIVKDEYERGINEFKKL